MSGHENVKILQKYFEQFSAQDMDGMDRLLSDDFTVEIATGAEGPMNKAQHRQYIQNFLSAFPDGRFDVTLTVAEGNYVVAHWIAMATHTGPLGTPAGITIPASGKQVKVPGVSTAEVKNGKIARYWVFWDTPALSPFYF